jgi:hypothetical protein
MSKKHTGSRYEETRGESRTAIAARIRADIKALVKSGKLPKGKYSVRTRSYAGGGSIDVSISDLAVSRVMNPAREEYLAANPHANWATLPAEAVPHYSPAVMSVHAAIEAIHDSYNYNNSDSMTDYFDVRYYGSVTIDYGWFADRKESELRAPAPQPPVRLLHPPTDLEILSDIGQRVMGARPAVRTAQPRLRLVGAAMTTAEIIADVVEHARSTPVQLTYCETCERVHGEHSCPQAHIVREPAQVLFLDYLGVK